MLAGMPSAFGVRRARRRRSGHRSRARKFVNPAHSSDGRVRPGPASRSAFRKRSLAAGCRGSGPHRSRRWRPADRSWRAVSSCPSRPRHSSDPAAHRRIQRQVQQPVQRPLDRRRTPSVASRRAERRSRSGEMRSGSIGVMVRWPRQRVLLRQATYLPSRKHAGVRWHGACVSPAIAHATTSRAGAGPASGVLMPRAGRQGAS